MYKLGKRSQERLKGLHPDLVKVVERAIAISKVDFTVIEGRRSVERQEELVAKGASKTMDSRHLTGHAVDVAPWVNNTVEWNDWSYYYLLAAAMKQAAFELRVPLEWGAIWDRQMTQLSDDLEEEVKAYKKRRAPRKAFLDGPHFQLPKGAYPG